MILVEGTSENVVFGDLDKALDQADTQLRLFGKPAVAGKRRMGVAVARGTSIEDARNKAAAASSAVTISL